MSKEFTKDDVIFNKKEAIKSLNRLIESYINDPSEKHLKKANLISYWIKDYVKYIKFEESFEPTKNIAYKRGNIVKLNFGFNVGSEHGGLHYAVVIDNHNDHRSPVLTVIPLTSIKSQKSAHNNSVELGNEVYRSLKVKYDTISQALKSEQEDISTTLDAFNSLLVKTNDALNEIDQYDAQSIEYSTRLHIAEQSLKEAEKLRDLWKKKQQHNIEEQNYLKKIGDEISQMKEGSIALVNQITTVSKMRIFDPRNLKGVLFGISLSKESMKKINEKLKTLYIF